VVVVVPEVDSDVLSSSVSLDFFFVHKIWANTAPAQGTYIIPYGLGFKIMSMVYTPGKGGAVNVDNLDFRSDEDGDEVEEKSSKKKSKGKAKEEDNEEEEEKSDKKKSKGKAKEEDNEEEEEKSDKKKI